MDSGELQLKIKKLKNIPLLPHLMLKFTQMAKDPHVSMSAFAEELSKDQTITSKLLRLVNSAYYGFPGRISTVTQALVLLGVDAVKGLIVTSSVFDGLLPEAYPLWRHSLITSVVARHVANHNQMQDVEEIAVAALLHDIGKVIFVVESPDDYRRIVKISKDEGISFYEAETRSLDFNHAKIGYWLCEQWTLPDKLKVPITFHHKPLEAPVFKDRACVVAFANMFVNAMGGGAEPELSLSDIPSGIYKMLNLTPGFLDSLIEKVDPELQAIQHVGPLDLK